ncbi:MAG: TetR/AcrR family transcriptional regulator C-terminal domain-containing protein [Aristaeellaceae bacterium]
MKHEDSSRMTRTQLAEALKRRMARKPLSKITVSELVSDCHMNRKTFYYHFQDIYALFKWMLEQETIEVVRQFDMLIDFREVLEFAMDYVLTNQHMLNAAYDAIGREGLKQFFYQDFIGLAQGLIDSLAHQQEVTLAESFRAFLCDFFTEAMASVLLSWVQQPSAVTRDKEWVLNYMEHLLQTALPAVIRSAKDKGPGYVVG